MLIVNGPSTDDGNGHTTAVDGTCADCGGVKLRHVQVSLTQKNTMYVLRLTLFRLEINGTRAGAGPIGGGMFSNTHVYLPSLTMIQVPTLSSAVLTLVSSSSMCDLSILEVGLACTFKKVA